MQSGQNESYKSQFSLGVGAGRQAAVARRGEDHLGNVLILGLGVSGLAVLRYCLALLGSRIDGLFIAAGQPNSQAEEAVEAACAQGAFAVFGDDAVSELLTHVPEGHFDLCIPSPGIAPNSKLYQAGRRHSSLVYGEVEFAWRESSPESTWVAVTGTNGKTTTTALTAFVLCEAGLDAQAVGNIGQAAIDAVATRPQGCFVVETSSYQLYSTVDFAPNIAIILNITPDHLKWHGSFETYAQAKFKLLDNLKNTPSSLAVLDASDERVRSEIRRLKAFDEDKRGFAYLPLGTKEGYSGDMRQACGSKNAAFVAQDRSLCVALDGCEHRLGLATSLQIRGAHNLGNALAAASCAVALGCSDAAIQQGLESFAPLEHRIEPCGGVAGVTFYNDSKATNVDATLKAIAAFPDEPLVVLLGGDDKGTDLAPLVAAAHQHARAVICFGEAGKRFFQAFEDFASAAPMGFETYQVSKLACAFNKACAIAKAGEVVLLSPACASFDEFSCFEERGEVFKRLVANYSAQQSTE